MTKSAFINIQMLHVRAVLSVTVKILPLKQSMYTVREEGVTVIKYLTMKIIFLELIHKT